MEDENTRQVRCYNFFSDSNVMYTGQSFTSRSQRWLSYRFTYYSFTYAFETRTSDRVLVLGKVLVDELDRVLNLVEGFVEELKLVLDLVEGFLKELKLVLVLVELFCLLVQQLCVKHDIHTELYKR
jgi:hypothetical protein